MSFGDLTRINTNVQALQSLHALQKTNAALGHRQLRLATGSRINGAEDDSAGYSIAKKLEARVRGQAQAMANVGDAKSLLTVAEGSLNTIMDILQTMKEKVVQAANDTLGAAERTSIKNQLDQLSAEVGDILTGTTFNGKNLFTAATAGVSLTFQVNSEKGDTFAVTIAAISASLLSVATGDLVVSANTSAANTLGRVNTAIETLATRLGSLGDAQKRLSFKLDNLQTAMNNNESARSRIADADFAREQMEVVKLQILQQTGTASLAQANVSPSGVLSLF